MTQACIYQPPRASPTTLGIVILLHGVALGALALARMDVVVHRPDPPIHVIDVPIEHIPKVIPPDPAKPLPPQEIDHFKPVVPTPPPPSNDNGFKQPETHYTDPGPTKPEPWVEPVRQPPIETPVRREAAIDPHSELKPPYPASEQRMGTEGSVTLRVLIGPDGRVRSAEKVRATNDAFYQATLRHALRNWRFKPATVDGRPIESSKVMTVHFSLDGDA
jgi:protein TonB